MDILTILLSLADEDLFAKINLPRFEGSSIEKRGKIAELLSTKEFNSSDVINLFSKSDDYVRENFKHIFIRSPKELYKLTMCVLILNHTSNIRNYFKVLSDESFTKEVEILVSMEIYSDIIWEISKRNIQKLDDYVQNPESIAAILVNRLSRTNVIDERLFQRIDKSLISDAIADGSMEYNTIEGITSVINLLKSASGYFTSSDTLTILSNAADQGIIEKHSKFVDVINYIDEDIALKFVGNVANAIFNLGLSYQDILLFVAGDRKEYISNYTIIMEGVYRVSNNKEIDLKEIRVEALSHENEPVEEWVNQKRKEAV